jgi:hypothetical protein
MKYYTWKSYGYYRNKPGCSFSNDVVSGSTVVYNIRAKHDWPKKVKVKYIYRVGRESYSQDLMFRKKDKEPKIISLKGGDVLFVFPDGKVVTDYVIWGDIHEENLVI